MTTDERDETELERLDRHWAELLQEVRVSQTGVAVLTGFLLTLPFQGRFLELANVERGLYLVTVALAAGSMVALIAPVAMHRLLFRVGARPRLVAQAQWLALLGLTLLALALACALTLIFDVVLGRTWGLVTGGVTLTVLLVLWLALPLVTRAGLDQDRDHAGMPRESASGGTAASRP